jgi:hypothetical protein
MSNVTDKEVTDFSEHCVFIYSVYGFAERLFKNSDARKKIDEATAPLFFEDLAIVFADFPAKERILPLLYGGRAAWVLRCPPA